MPEEAKEVTPDKAIAYIEQKVELVAGKEEQPIVQANLDDQDEPLLKRILNYETAIEKLK